MSDYHGSVSDEDRPGKERRKRAGAKNNKKCRVRPEYVPTFAGCVARVVSAQWYRLPLEGHLSQPASQHSHPEDCLTRHPLLPGHTCHCEIVLLRLLGRPGERMHEGPAKGSRRVCREVRVRA